MKQSFNERKAVPASDVQANGFLMFGRLVSGATSEV